ncbi:hypothetical protein TNCV_4020871 [Trichonephila clavipes]|nr:hypothetical protein TNCV_4020871 [Trichonephila clavipes]
MDFTEINSRGKRGELLGRIDRQNSRFRTAKTIIKFGLHAFFVELESAKNAFNEAESVPGPNDIGHVIGEFVHLAKQIYLKVDSGDVQELLDFHNQKLTMDELIEMQEQDIGGTRVFRPISIRKSNNGWVFD